MAKPDPKDDRIAELELQLEAANKATAAAESAAQELTGLRAELLKRDDAVATRDARILALTSELKVLKDATSNSGKATITGLDPAKAVQLSVSSMVTNVVTGQPVTAVAGSVLVVKEAFEGVAKKVGTSAAVYPVTLDEIEAAKKAGRAH